jgi:hypothetical protein
MTELPPLILARDRILHSLTAKELARRCASGQLIRVRHGVYVDGAAWQELQKWEQYRVRIHAAAEMFETRTVFARHSAATLWGIPTLGVHHPVEALTMKNDGGRSRAGVRRYFADPRGLNAALRNGLYVTSRVRTVLDLAAYSTFPEAIVPLDHVLRPDKAAGLPALSKAELLAGIDNNYSAAAVRRIEAALAFADPLSGSAGESFSRAIMWAAGFEAPVLQQEIKDDAGLVGYSDYYWDTVKVAGEFDGVQKYMKPEYLKGRNASQVVVAEKWREDRIRAAGVSVVRWSWAEVLEQGRLERKLAAAGVPRRRARSANW